jgi:copper chaperone CopZ
MRTPTKPTEGQMLEVKGMTCGGCLRSVQQALSSVPGVERVTVDLSSGRADVEGSAKPDALIGAVQAIGYEARLADGAETTPTSEKSGCC